MVGAWRGILRIMPPREAAIVVIMGGVAFGLGVALGRVTAPPAAPLDQGYVTIEHVSSHEPGTEPSVVGEEGPRQAAEESGQPGVIAPVSGAGSSSDDEGRGVVGPVPSLGVTTPSQSQLPATASSLQPESLRSADREGAGGAAAKPEMPAASGGSSAARPAGSSVQTPKETTAQASRREKMLMPVQGRIISEFGWRRHPVFADWRYHTGIDIAASEGIPVRAALSGKVVEVDTDRQLGLYVVLEHEGGLRTKYCHLESSPASCGDSVAQGESIGMAGSSGVTSGCYVHFEVISGGKAQDPRKFL
ncbi:MAG: peptidoglycan DD-metalloendopeptidase family protein [Firmicutes bacterium]|jgi:murein DD-endopeptidase MepM/ murein hydrolase activator NlpD|nr:peptidoglycan DD-metalloendopeptidase family protein [Bacillota bacterium]MDH7494365.1 peptidoglycan DD-metalloendopeptidase family protein [Bacillota bacterium]